MTYITSISIVYDVVVDVRATSKINPALPREYCKEDVIRAGFELAIVGQVDISTLPKQKTYISFEDKYQL